MLKDIITRAREEFATKYGEYAAHQQLDKESFRSWADTFLEEKMREVAEKTWDAIRIGEASDIKKFKLMIGLRKLYKQFIGE